MDNTNKELQLKIFDAYSKLKIAFIVANSPHSFKDSNWTIGKLIREATDILGEIIVGFDIKKEDI